MIIAYQTIRHDNVLEVTVTSDLAGTVYYHWYFDGTYLGMTTGPRRSFYLDEEDQADLVVLDTTDEEFDPVASAPAGYPPRRTLFWCRSLDEVAHYRIEQQRDAGAWETVGRVYPAPGDWSFTWETTRLVDLASYAWRIVPVDAADRDGTPVTLSAEKIVRVPDAPDFTATFNPATRKVAIGAA